MFTSFLILFRESLEAALVIGIILSYLLKTRQTKYNNLIYLSIASGIVASILFAFFFQFIAGGFEGAAGQIFEGVTMVLAAILLTFMIMWMMKQREIAKHFHRRIDEKINTGRMFGLFMIGFFAVIREGVETVIFLNAAEFVNGPENILGALLGVIAAIILGYLVFAEYARVNVKRFFQVTSLLLIAFSASLIWNAIGEFQEAGIMLPKISTIILQGSAITLYLAIIFIIYMAIKKSIRAPASVANKS